MNEEEKEGRMKRRERMNEERMKERRERMNEEQNGGRKEKDAVNWFVD